MQQDLPKSMRFKNVVKIKNEILSILDNNQELKRLCTYLSPTPLASRGLLKGNSVKQPDITKSLIKDNLIPYGFNDKLLDSEMVLIFCGIYDIKFERNNVMDTNIFMISIMLPSNYNDLQPYGDERIIEIASRIADELDNKSLNNGMSNIKIRSGSMANYRKHESKDYLILTIPLEISTSSARDI